MAEEEIKKEEDTEEGEGEEGEEKKKKIGKRVASVMQKINPMTPGGLMTLVVVVVVEIIDILIPECIIDSLFLELLLEVPIYFMLMLNTDLTLGQVVKQTLGVLIQERIPFISWIPSYLSKFGIPVDFVGPIIRFVTSKKGGSDENEEKE